MTKFWRKLSPMGLNLVEKSLVGNIFVFNILEIPCIYSVWVVHSFKRSSCLVQEVLTGLYSATCTSIYQNVFKNLDNWRAASSFLLCASWHILTTKESHLERTVPKMCRADFECLHGSWNEWKVPHLSKVSVSCNSLCSSTPAKPHLSWGLFLQRFFIMTTQWSSRGPGLYLKQAWCLSKCIMEIPRIIISSILQFFIVLLHVMASEVYRDDVTVYKYQLCWLLCHGSWSGSKASLLFEVFVLHVLHFCFPEVSGFELSLQTKHGFVGKWTLFYSDYSNISIWLFQWQFWTAWANLCISIWVWLFTWKKAFHTSGIVSPVILFHNRNKNVHKIDSNYKGEMWLWWKYIAWSRLIQLW